jgi:hypothetical protein
MYLAAIAVFGVTLPLLFVFGAGLIVQLRDRDRGFAATVSHLALATLVTGMALAYLLLLPFLFGDGLGADATDGMLRYAYVLTFVVSMVGTIGGAAFIAAVSVGQSGAAAIASRVVAGLMVVSSVGGLVNPGMAMVGGLGFFAMTIWSVVVGVAMWRDVTRVPQAALRAA